MCDPQPATTPPTSSPPWYARLLVADVKRIAIYSKWIGLANPPFRAERLILTNEHCGYRRYWSPEEKIDQISSDLVQQFLTTLSEQEVAAPDVPELDAAAAIVQHGGKFAWTDDYPSLLIEIHTSSGQSICLHSDVQHVFMLPLMLFQDSRFVGKTYDLHLSLSIAALMPDEFLGKNRLAGTGGWIRDDVPDVTPAEPPEESAPEPTPSSPQDREPASGDRNAVTGGLLKIVSQEESAAQKAEAERLGKISRRLLKRHSVEDLREVLARGANPSVADECGQTALMLAAFPPFAEIQFEILAEAGADLEARRNDGFTGLHLACLGGSDEVALAWVRAGANIHARTAHGSTPLMLACGSNRTVHLLLRAGANPNDVDNDGHTALCCVVIAQGTIDPENQLESIRALIAAGTYLNTRDRNGKTAMGHAYHVFHSAQVEADVHRAFARETNPAPSDELQLATDIIKMLEEAGAEV